ncbi:hypothetical protein AVEN_186615-1 [Araneus ventricosus]|uniref:Uncharacterized protein n=1 Tax=Araneus ventricosus TaxID=182803 RepID=A0A4Y2THV7_ARAVE|nr:hypothetical protein AVEN_186615-1 [Araneus ventricosus]
MSRFEATQGLFWDGPRNFEPRSDTRTSELAPPLKSLHHNSEKTFDPLRMILCATALIYDGSSEESGFEPGTLSCRHLTSTPSLPHKLK